MDYPLSIWFYLNIIRFRNKYMFIDTSRNDGFIDIELLNKKKMKKRLKSMNIKTNVVDNAPYFKYNDLFHGFEYDNITKTINCDSCYISKNGIPIILCDIYKLFSRPYDRQVFVNWVSFIIKNTLSLKQNFNSEHGYNYPVSYKNIYDNYIFNYILFYNCTPKKLKIIIILIKFVINITLFSGKDNKRLNHYADITYIDNFVKEYERRLFYKLICYDLDFNDKQPIYNAPGTYFILITKNKHIGKKINTVFKINTLNIYKTDINIDSYSVNDWQYTFYFLNIMRINFY